MSLRKLGIFLLAYLLLLINEFCVWQEPAFARVHSNSINYIASPPRNPTFIRLADVTGEGGNTNQRDDAIAYFPASDTFSRYDARFAENGRKTYWWAWTRPGSEVRALLK